MRIIDGDKLVEKLRLIATCWSISPYVSKEKHNGAVNMLREVEREVKEAPTFTLPNEWISVKDRLPERDGEYIVFVKNLTGSIVLGNPVFISYFFQNAWIYDGWTDNTVTHWIPLPEPPKE